MKKTVVILISIILFSCSNDDSGTSEPQLNTEGSLLKKAITSVGGTVIEDADYVCNGNKLAQIKRSTTNYTNYTYTGNLITKAEIYVNNSLSSTGTFTYNSDQLIQSLLLSNTANMGYKSVYTYNPDGTISLTKYEGDLISQNTVTENFKIFFTNGMVSKREKYQVINGNMETLTYEYTYDTKNNMYNSILGLNKLTFYDNESALGSSNNVTSTTVTATNTSNVAVYTTQYTYNSYNYPITKTDIYPDGSTAAVSQLYYE